MDHFYCVSQKVLCNKLAFQWQDQCWTSHFHFTDVLYKAIRSPHRYIEAVTEEEQLDKSDSKKLSGEWIHCRQSLVNCFVFTMLCSTNIWSCSVCLLNSLQNDSSVYIDSILRPRLCTWYKTMLLTFFKFACINFLRCCEYRVARRNLFECTLMILLLFYSWPARMTWEPPRSVCW